MTLNYNNNFNYRAAMEQMDVTARLDSQEYLESEDQKDQVTNS